MRSWESKGLQVYNTLLRQQAWFKPTSVCYQQQFLFHHSHNDSLILKPRGVTGFKFLLKVSPLKQKLRPREQRK